MALLDNTEPRLVSEDRRDWVQLEDYLGNTPLGTDMSKIPCSCPLDLLLMVISRNPSNTRNKVNIFPSSSRRSYEPSQCKIASPELNVHGPQGTHKKKTIPNKVSEIGQSFMGLTSYLDLIGLRGFKRRDVELGQGGKKARPDLINTFGPRMNYHCLLNFDPMV